MVPPLAVALLLWLPTVAVVARSALPALVVLALEQGVASPQLALASAQVVLAARLSLLVLLAARLLLAPTLPTLVVEQVEVVARLLVLLA